MQAMIRQLGEEKVDSVMVERRTLAWSFLKAGLVNRVQYHCTEDFGGQAPPTQ